MQDASINSESGLLRPQHVHSNIDTGNGASARCSERRQRVSTNPEDLGTRRWVGETLFPVPTALQRSEPLPTITSIACDLKLALQDARRSRQSPTLSLGVYASRFLTTLSLLYLVVSGQSPHGQKREQGNRMRDIIVDPTRRRANVPRLRRRIACTDTAASQP